MRCKQCKRGNLILQYKIFVFEKPEVYFDSLEEAENRYEKYQKDYSDMGLSLCQLVICDNCDYIKEIVLKKEEI